MLEKILRLMLEKTQRKGLEKVLGIENWVLVTLEVAIWGLTFSSCHGDSVQAFFLSSASFQA